LIYPINSNTRRFTLINFLNRTKPLLIWAGGCIWPGFKKLMGVKRPVLGVEGGKSKFCDI
jgi:hypothetical protein